VQRAGSASRPCRLYLYFSVSFVEEVLGTGGADRIKASRPAQVTATLRDAKNRRLHTWRLGAGAGANMVRLRLPAKIRRPGSYRLIWVARSGTETVSRTIRFALVARR
jgi:hypothetical protein